MGKTVRQILSPDTVRQIDGLLAGREATRARLQEERLRNDALLKPDGDVDTTNAEAQRGREMHRSEFVRRVLKLNPSLWYEQSIRYPEQGALYIHDDSVKPYTKRMVASMPHGMIPEFSTVMTVPSLVPSLDMAPVWDAIKQVDSRIPGWRAVLAKLLIGKLLTPAQIDREFQISRGRPSQNWQAVTQ